MEKELNNRKSIKGITLISLSIAVIVLLIVTGTIIYNVKSNLGVQKLKAMQTDIANIRAKVSIYYAQYGDIPIKHEYSNITNLNKINVISSEADTGKFYVIELESLDNLTLTYGKDYEKIRTGEVTTDAEINELTDIYIINEDSQNIFYVHGIRFDNEMFYTDYTAEDVDTEKVALRSMMEICTSTNMYNRTENTTIEDEYGNEITIPAGFRLVIDDTTNNASHVTEGMVIEDKEGNQFVWIPVELGEGETFETQYPRTVFSNNAPAAGLAQKEYTEPYENGYEGEDIEYQKMIDSVTKNGGFYVGRYETGFNGTEAKKTYTSYSTKPTSEEVLSETQKLVVKKGAYVYNYVPWGSEMNNITAYNKGTTDAPQYVIGAVELSNNFAKANNYDTSKVTSTLIYGIQWDMMLRFVADDEHNVNDSRSWGNYEDSTGEAKTNSGSSNMNYKAGRNEAWKAKNIYDIAGNVREWTMEAYYAGSRVSRGGSYRYSGSSYPASNRSYHIPYNSYHNISFRIALYL